ncbi:hypothetical protein D5R95_03925 [Methanosalsum natronophilum]|uniref:Uncharacterized protein n=1 Tax=Methanosalsum natronophilum TaxID=768733 RepID=A0A3R7VUC2_9EURY|nr:MAG: hypothetical protein D5R95_03925 [Methanosalsum natronophilum]
MIWKIVYKRRWCPKKHIRKRDLIKGKPCNDDYKKALHQLVKEGIFQEYKSQGRNDVCIPKIHKAEIMKILKKHKDQYDFIIGLEFIQ